MIVGDRQSAYRACIDLARGQAKHLLLFSFFANLLLLTSAIYMLQVFERVLSSRSVSTLLWLTVLAVVATGAYALIEVTRRRLLDRTASWLEQELAPRVLRRNLQDKMQGQFSQADLSDVQQLKSFLAGDAVLAFLDAPWIPLFIVFIWVLDPLLGMLAIGGAIGLFALAVLNDLATRRRQSVASVELKGLFTASNHLLENAETVAGLGMTDTMVERWKDAQSSLRSGSDPATDLTQILSNLSRFVRLTLQVAILAAGAYLVLKGQLTPGGMIAASIVLSRALSPVERSIGAWRGFVAARAAHRDLQALFDATPAMEHGSIALPAPRGEIVLEDVRFYPTASARHIIGGVSLRIPAGQTCGLIGPSGSGKSTLCKLIVGAWTPSFGAVRLDGAEIASWAQSNLGRHIGYLPQCVELFAGTVAENIARMGEPDQRAVLAAAQTADAHEFILNLPNGYDTSLGLGGVQLSGGQAQRIGIARALYHDPAVVVLDEPDAHLDGDGEGALVRTLTALREQGKSVVLVVHRAALLRTCDTLALLADGRLKRFGPRDEVLVTMGAKRVASTGRVAMPAPATAGPAAPELMGGAP